MFKLWHQEILTAGTALLLGACATSQGGNADIAANPEVRIDMTEDFLAALAAEDSDTILSMLTPAAQVHAPFNPSGNTKDSDIRTFPAALYLTGAMATYDNLVFEDRKFSVADNNNTIWVEAEGKLRVAATGKPYENRYVFKMEFDGPKISRITEYVNVATLARDGVPAVAP